MTKRATKRSATASDTIRKLVDVRSTFSCEENRLQGYQLPKDKTVMYMQSETVQSFFKIL